MDKIAVGGDLPEGVVQIEASPAENLKNPNAIARSTGVADRAAAWGTYWSIRGLPAGHSRCGQCQTSARGPPSSWEASVTIIPLDA